jgi:[acyl-carrier-protein] S-malonyltransferase
MGTEFCDRWPASARQFARLDRALDFDLAARCFATEQGDLDDPPIVQPALYAVGLAAYAGLTTRFDVSPSLLAGHSLGHFPALAASGSLDAVAGVRLVRRRGRAVTRVTSDLPESSMIAVLGPDAETVAAVCTDREHAHVCLRNSPQLSVIGGRVEAVATARAAIATQTSARFVELDVAAPFHSPEMEPAVEPLQAALDAVSLTSPTTPIVSDVTGAPYSTASGARTHLHAQITSPIDWPSVVRTLVERGVERVVELPPAGALGRWIEAIEPGLDVISLTEPAVAERHFDRR